MFERPPPVEVESWRSERDRARRTGWPYRHDCGSQGTTYAASFLRANEVTVRGYPCPGSRRWRPAETGCRSAAGIERVEGSGHRSALADRSTQRTSSDGVWVAPNPSQQTSLAGKAESASRQARAREDQVGAVSGVAPRAAAASAVGRRGGARVRSLRPRPQGAFPRHRWRARADGRRHGSASGPRRPDCVPPRRWR
jgi:hypothetical protein